MATWIIGSLVIGLMLVVAVFSIRRTVKRAKTGDCSCGCSGCPSAGSCHSGGSHHV